MARSNTQEGSLGRKDDLVPDDGSVIDPCGRGQRDLRAGPVKRGLDSRTAGSCGWPRLLPVRAAVGHAEWPATAAGRGRSDRVFSAGYRGVPSAVGQARRDEARMLDGFPAAETLILLLSEVATNAVMHSRSGLPGGHFAVVVVDLLRGEYAKVTVIDDGGPWAGRAHGGDIAYRHGLSIVQDLSAGMCIEGDDAGRAVWFVCGWAAT